MNRSELIGRLGQDPEIKTVSSGNTVCRLSIATSEKYTDKNGQKQEKTQWTPVVFWGKQAEICGKCLKKGSQVYVSGRLETRSYEDSQGVKKYITEIIGKEIEFLSPKEAVDINEPAFDSEEPMPF